MEHQQRVGAVAPVAEAVIREDPVVPGLAGDRLDSRKTLDRLADERKGDPGWAAAMQRSRVAHHRAGRVDAQIARAREFTRHQRVAWGIDGRQGHREGGQERMTGQDGLEALIGRGWQRGQHRGGKQKKTHGEEPHY